MVDELFVSIHDVQLLIDDCDLCGQNVRGIPQSLTQAVELRFRIGKVSDSLRMDEEIAVDGFDNCVLHFGLPSFLLSIVAYG